jgi:hypothetical protein
MNVNHINRQQLNASKGLVRQYRKRLRAAGVKFPLRGAFYVTDQFGQFVCPENVSRDSALQIVAGPIPNIGTPVHPDLSKRLPPAPVPEDSIFGDPLPSVFKRLVRVSPTDGRKRIDYRPVKNPKPNQSCWVKAIVNERVRWVETTYGDGLNEMNLA